MTNKQHDSMEKRMQTNVPVKTPGPINQQLMTGLVLVFVLAVGILYLVYSWNRYLIMQKKDTVELAQSIEALLPKTHITSIVHGADVAEADWAHLLKNHLIRLVEANDAIYYVCILGKKKR